MGVIKLTNMELNIENYEKMINLIPELLCITSMDGSFIYANSAFERILGYNSSEILELNLYELLHKDDSINASENAKLINENKMEYSIFEHRYRCKNGTYKWITWSVRIQWDEQLVYSSGYDITERKNMENNLLVTQQKYSNVLNNADAVIMQIDRNGIILLNEGKALKKLGFKPGEFVGHSIFDIFKDEQGMIDCAKLALKGEERTNEFHINRRIVSTSFTPLKDDNGMPNGGIIIATDTTKRKIAELELAKTSQKLQEAQKFAHIGYWEYDAENGNFPWSDEVFTIFGLEPQQFIPKLNYFLTMVHPDDMYMVMNILNGNIENYELEIDLRVIRRDNKIIYTYQKIKCEFDENRKLIKAYGIIQDITQRKLDEASLRESEEKYKSLANNVPVGIFLYDKDGNITFMNPKVIEILDFPSNEVNMPLNLFKSESSNEYGISDVYKQCIGTGKLITAEKQYTTKWGKSVTLRLQITPIRNNSDEVVSAIAIIEDFTERKKLEIALYEAKEAAESSNKAKSQFIANMSHEIRTPMNGIMGMTDLLLLTDLTDEQSEMAQLVQSSSKSLLKIINDILDFSKIDAGKIDFNLETIEFLKFIDSIAKLYMNLAKEKGVEFEVYIDNKIPKKIVADKTRLAQIINNLIGNAIKFTEKGKIKVSIKNIETLSNKVHLMFSIEDTGIGIREEDKTKLFTYFTQLDDVMTKRFQGTGLGLAICKSLVEQMQGEIYVESDYGKGSTFHFTCFVNLHIEKNAEHFLKNTT